MRSTTMLGPALLVGTVLLLAGCYTLLTHPQIATDEPVAAQTQPVEQAPVEPSRSCSDCHAGYYTDPYYHWPFYYDDPPVGSWLYGERFYHWPLYSSTYYQRHRYYAAYPWWWNTRFHPVYRDRHPARYTHPKIEPKQRDWDRTSGFGQPMPSVGFGTTKPQTPSFTPAPTSTRRPSDSLPKLETQPPAPSVTKTTPKDSGQQDDEDEEEEEGAAQDNQKRSSRGEGMQ